MLLEGADKGRVSIGIVDSSYNHGLAPGLSGSVGFNTDLKMFDIERQTSSGGKQVTGKRSSVVYHSTASYPHLRITYSLLCSRFLGCHATLPQRSIP